MEWAYWVRVPPCSTGLSSGPSACAHWLSLRPSQKSHGLYAVPTTVMVLRLVVPTPCANGKPSLKFLPGRWQLAQETAPFLLKRASKKSLWPSSAARGLSATALEGSGGSGLRLPSHRPRRVLIWSALQPDAGQSA